MQLDPQTIYDQTHTWQNANDRVAWQRTIAEGSPEEQKMARDLMNADPGTPSSYIANTMTAFRIPPRYGYDTTPPTIYDVIELSSDDNISDPHASDYMMTDFSGSKARREGSEIPSMPMW